jgi:pimeloyl-ACP methyl ester carboxylesterase
MSVTGRQSRHLDQLPPGTRVVELPGCGHVPMADDPEAVTAVIVESAARALAEHRGGAAGAGPARTGGDRR